MIITSFICANTIVKDKVFFNEDLEVYEQNYSIYGENENCDVSFNIKTHDLLSYTCLIMIDVNGNDVFCTRNKQICKNKSDIFGTKIKIQKTFKNDLHEKINICSSEHAKLFSQLKVQDNTGNILPIDKMANALIKKITGRVNFSEFSATQLLIGMILQPKIYQYIPMIEIKNKKIASLIGINKERKYAKFSDFFDEEGTYKIFNEVNNTYRIKESLLTPFEQELKAIDERVNLSYDIYQGNSLRIFQNPKKNHDWHNPLSAIKKFNSKDSEQIKNLISDYFNATYTALQTSQWNKANKKLKKLIHYQLLQEKEYKRSLDLKNNKKIEGTYIEFLKKQYFKDCPNANIGTVIDNFLYRNVLI